MNIDLSRFRDVFFDEAVEHHRALEAGLLQLEAGGDHREALDSVFRAAHSIKGSSGAFDLPAITSYTHALESLLDQMRRQTVAITPALIGRLLRAADLLRDLIACSRSGDPLPSVAASLAELGAACVQAAPTPDAPVGPSRSHLRTVSLSITPQPRLLARGSDPLLLLRELSELGRVIHVRAELSALPDLAHIDPEICYVSWTVRLESDASLERLREVFLFVEGDCGVTIDEGAPATPGATGDAIAAEPAARPPAPARRWAADRRASESGSLRVTTDKVDHLIDLVGELVIAQSMVNQVMHSFEPARMPALREAVAGMERNLRELQEQVMSVRMVTMGTVFGRFPRLVHDLAAAMGKDVALRIEGEETELDKGMIERLGDPLTHLVRNCVDHGLETPEERRLAGKAPQGVLGIRALHEGGHVVVEVADDGRGLDLERIRAKGVALGLLPAGSQPGEADIRELIFQPGFSTAEAVSDVSGRGVGMDVVRRNVEELGGSVHIDSEPGCGTCFRIKLPLTLAILDGLLVAVGAQTFIVPLLAVVESIQLRPGDVRLVQGRSELAIVRGEPLPLLRLADLLGVRDAQGDATRGIVVILENAQQRVALLVDDLVGQSQVVIKNLEANVGHLEGVMGATILGNGTVAMILDTQGLIGLATRRSRSADGAPRGGLSRELQATGA